MDPEVQSGLHGVVLVVRPDDDTQSESQINTRFAILPAQKCFVWLVFFSKPLLIPHSCI